MKILAIIPARSGSKRVPKKNIKLIAGRPLIEWTIDAAKKASSVDRIFVSTDSAEIAEVCQRSGLTVPYLRPPELSTDTSKSIDVVKWVIDQLKADGYCYDFVLLLQATSPLRKASHIEAAIKMAREKDADGIASVCECEHSPVWAATLTDDGAMNNFLNDSLNDRSQDLPKYYRLNGAIYLARIDRLYEEGSFIFNSRCYAFEMEQESSVDIDSSLDFSLADMILTGRLMGREAQ